MSESMQEQIAAAILEQCDNLAVAPCRACRQAAAIARAFEPAVEGDDVVAGEHRDAHGRIWACPACAGVIPAHQMSQPMRSLHDEALAAPPAPHGDSGLREGARPNPDCAARNRPHGPHKLMGPGGNKPGAYCDGLAAHPEVDA